MSTLFYKGINYDTGTNYMPGYLSREIWNDSIMQDEIRVIKEELHCNTINFFGSEIDRLIACASTAAQNGLKVWLQPRLIDSSPVAMLEHLAELALEAERLRKNGADVTLNVGCELSIFMSGLFPGETFFQRGARLGYLWWLWMLLPRFNNRLNMHLRQACVVARGNFKGSLTYGAGIWESVDWSPFDFVGLNYYRDWTNKGTYINDLRGFRKWNKPIVITEFGCCTYEGAEKKGASGEFIVDWNKTPPQIKGKPTRSEKVQADYIAELLAIYRDEGIHGAFVFEFIEPPYPHSPDPLYDMDMASFGIVKVDASTDSLRWEPKQAFHEIARIYGAQSRVKIVVKEAHDG